MHKILLWEPKILFWGQYLWMRTLPSQRKKHWLPPMTAPFSSEFGASVQFACQSVCVMIVLIFYSENLIGFQHNQDSVIVGCIAPTSNCRNDSRRISERQRVACPMKLGFRKIEKLAFSGGKISPVIFSMIFQSLTFIGLFDDYNAN